MRYDQEQFKHYKVIFKEIKTHLTRKSFGNAENFAMTGMLATTQDKCYVKFIDFLVNYCRTFVLSFHKSSEDIQAGAFFASIYCYRIAELFSCWLDIYPT